MKIRDARLKAGLSQREVAFPFKKSGQWLLLLEQGRLPITRELEKSILTVIERLTTFRADLEKRKASIVVGVTVRPQGRSIR